MSYVLALSTILMIRSQKPAPNLPKGMVTGSTVSSSDCPQVQVTLPPTFKYLGADRWVLFSVADCEIHVFVEADSQRRVKSYCWVQFEEYLPSKPDNFYSYTTGVDLKISGFDFNMRPRFGLIESPPKPGSEIEHVMKIVKSAGYSMPAEIVNVRLVHLPEPTKRKEMMILFAEDMQFYGVKFSDLVVDGKLSDNWAPVESALVKRVLDRVKIEPFSKSKTKSE